jgi:hydrogenase maturation protein HypF
MNTERAKVAVRGAVQGVGFRPHVFRLATELQLQGWVLNSSQGVFIEIEGASDMLRQFLLRLEKEKPSRAVVQSLEYSLLDPAGYEGFEIRESQEGGPKTALILPDIATCADCLRDILDPDNRRYRYPFTNCTNCGPRFSVIEALPYDRPNTSMKGFVMCPKCEREYRDPHDRRFHAQPNACPHCGPQLELWNAEGTVLSRADDALCQAVDLVRDGKICALKGLGGFQFIVNARDEVAVARLRLRKRREEKPFAVMYPSLEAVREVCMVSQLEERLLLSPESPIVLLRRWEQGSARILCASVAPRNPNLGVMLPYTPLHHLLLREFAFPVVATSGNLSDEPICTSEEEALERLAGVADAFLVHNRPIVRHVDDSIVRVVRNRELVLRRARGYAPLPVKWRSLLPCALGVGAHIKNSVALSVGDNVFVSQHIGDLETSQAWVAFRKVAADLARIFDVSPETVACDLHPDYLSTKYAAQSGTPIQKVQYHWAHALACMAENELEPPVLAVAWDGTGYGLDGTIWGGEFLRVTAVGFERVAHLRQFHLPGGDAAIKQPRRSALGLVHEIWDSIDNDLSKLAPVRDFEEREFALIKQMLTKGVNAPLTSSAGRLFDGVASLIGLRQHATFEGQAAMELEFVVDPSVKNAYPFQMQGSDLFIVDWGPTIEAIIDEIDAGYGVGVIAAKFHNTLAEMIVAVACRIEQPEIVLTGGCFQNCELTERCVQRLVEAGFRPHWHQRVPPNDGGIALGQIVAVSLATARARSELREVSLA